MTQACHNCGTYDLDVVFNAPAFDTSSQHVGVYYDVAICKQCSMHNTLDPDQDIDAAYSDEYYGTPDSKFLTLIESTVSALANSRARSLLRLWGADARERSQSSILDIGCGRGVLLRAFKSQGASVLGLEREGFVTSQTGMKEICSGSIYDPAYAKRKFDLIVLWHVLEHLENQDKLLDHLASALNSGGILILAVPNFGSWQRMVFGKYWFHLDLPRHLVHIDANWLRNGLSQRGFNIIREGHFDLLQNTYGFLQSALNTMAHKRQNALYRALKNTEGKGRSRILSVLGWGLLATFLLPFALADLVLGSLFKKGATVQFIARIEKPDD
ncbi:MAG: class I SAM-dependent methyltransferase [Halioglobus sp.]